MNTALLVKEDGKIYVDTGTKYILCADQDEAAGMIVLSMKFENPMKYRGSYAVGIRPGIYPIPGLKFDVVHLDIEDPVAIIYLPKQKEESQEELINELIQHTFGADLIGREEIAKNFTITRKQ